MRIVFTIFPLITVQSPFYLHSYMLQFITNMINLSQILIFIINAQVSLGLVCSIQIRSLTVKYSYSQIREPDNFSKTLFSFIAFLI